MRPALIAIALATTVMAGCSSAPPRPPEADEASRRPANTAAAVDLQACRSGLQNSRIAATEARREADVARTQAVLIQARAAAATPPAANTIFVLRFRSGSSDLDLSADEARQIAEAARDAPLVVLRGRTDGTRESAAESRVARARAAAVQAWLVRAGADPARVRATWQPVGDHAGDNGMEPGRALNRRVEIEIYRTAPRFVAAGQPANP